MNKIITKFIIFFFVIAGLCETAAACPCPPCLPCHHLISGYPSCNCKSDCDSGSECCNGGCCYSNRCESCIGGTCTFCGGNPNKGCCNGECYDLATQGCCDGTIYNLETQKCCGDGTGKTCDKDKNCCQDNCCDPDANECCYNGNCVHEKSAASISVSLSMPGYIVNKVQSAINRIPGVNTSINSASVSATESRDDCCYRGSFIDNGKGSVSGSATLSAELDGIKLWGGSFNYRFHSSFPADWSATVDAEAGVFLDADFSVSGTVGHHYNSCKDEGCFYGSLGAGTTITCSVTAGITGCVETPAGTYCGGASVTPASVSVSLTGSLHCNNADDCDGCGGDVTVGEIDFSAIVGCGPASVSWDCTIYKGD